MIYEWHNMSQPYSHPFANFHSTPLQEPRLLTKQGYTLRWTSGFETSLYFYRQVSTIAMECYSFVITLLFHFFFPECEGHSLNSGNHKCHYIL